MKNLGRFREVESSFLSSHCYSYNEKESKLYMERIAVLATFKTFHNIGEMSNSIFSNYRLLNPGNDSCILKAGWRF